MISPLVRALCVACMAALALGGCANLLPTARSEVASPWQSFEEARDTIERIVPGVTSKDELHALGIDPYLRVNVQLLSYSDVLLRFPITASVEHLDAGLKSCLVAGKNCTGYSIAVRDTRRERVGNFFEDALGFKRLVDISGWSFNALVLLVEDRVVYTLYGGQPHLKEQEVMRQPLGPLQNWGPAVGDLIRW